MTEYGRGLGSEPWHPEDPLYGDGWDGQQATNDGYGPYDGQQYPPPAGGGTPHSQWPGQPASYGAGQQYPDQQHYNRQQYGWDPAQGGGVTYGGGAGDPYGRPGPNPYGGERPGPYGTPEAYPPPQPPGGRNQQAYPAQGYDAQHQYPDQHQHRRPQTEPPATWESEPDAAEHPFFTGEPDRRRGRSRSDDDFDEEFDDYGPGRRDQRDRPKRRSGTALLVAGTLLLGAVGGIGYLGYDLWQEHFGPAPDFTGSGTGEVQVEIPDGAFGNEIGGILKKAGVVKSVDAFVEAQKKHPKGRQIQAGVYVLRKGMSAEAAVEMMTDPKSLSALIISEGIRASAVYSTIDKKLDLKAGTTKAVAKKQAKNLGLPEWADDDADIKDPLEGFLYPSRYSAAKGTKPEDVLRQMVDRAKGRYAQLGIERKADEFGLKSPLQVVTVASLVQAEGKTHDDFRKMADVVYNRLKPGNIQTNGKIEFDSAYNYLKNQSNIDIPINKIRNDPDPYNTYFHRGLPPGPIGNPGDEALRAALDPDKGGWFYFVAVDGNETKFAKTLKEHNRLVDEFNKNRRAKKG
ncbi:endolytic transglycosylase MltG [Streptomyces sp. KR80]|uniref:endolytic transglycosylase MltG n=1 Tax=Streptomyces sp. KR80 TaxID=3457426 RepID=UPI003FD1D3A9